MKVFAVFLVLLSLSGCGGTGDGSYGAGYADGFADGKASCKR